jgi:hypothetical protein
MTLAIASHPIQRIEGVSEQARLVLGFVGGGLQWLDWAIGVPRPHHFRDELALVEETQNALHGAPLLFLPGLGLWVSAAKLMAIPTADLRALEKAERAVPGTPMPARVQQIFAEHSLASARELDAGTRKVINASGMQDASLFQQMTLSDQLALFGLLPRGELPPGAADFARQHARTVTDFADYCRIWFDFGENSANDGDTAPATLEAAVDILLPLMFPALDCPQVDRAASAADVSSAIQEFATRGLPLGFLRLSQGLQQVIANAGFRTDDADEGRAILDSYLNGAVTLLMSSELQVHDIAQDGIRSFRAVGHGHEAIVALSPEGLITLTRYRGLPASAAAVPS